MCKEIVFDACSVGLYHKQRILDGGGAVVNAVEDFLLDGFILLDSGGIMLTEWIQSASFASHGEQSLLTWVSDLWANGKIRFIKLVPDPHLTNELRQLGLKRKDLKYLAAAYKTGAFALVSDDSDMYDPRLKAQSSKSRERAVKNRNGPVVRFARNRLNVEITPAEQTADVVPKCA